MEETAPGPWWTAGPWLVSDFLSGPSAGAQVEKTLTQPVTLCGNSEHRQICLAHCTATSHRKEEWLKVKILWKVVKI